MDYPSKDARYLHQRNQARRSRRPHLVHLFPPAVRHRPARPLHPDRGRQHPLDCITNLDQETIRFIKARGGLKAIAISHPHFYSTHLEWAHEFDCPIYLAAEDQEWLNRVDSEHRRIFYKGETIEILPGATMVKLGGHFPGSSALFWNGNLVRYSQHGHRLCLMLMGLRSVCWRFHWDFSGKMCI